MNTKPSALLPLLLAFAPLGCASMSAEPFYPGAREGLFGLGGDVSGIRFYEPTPVLIITSENVKVAFVPNPARGVAVGFRNFLAKQKLELQGEDGSFTKLTSETDATPIPAGVLTLLQTLGEAAIEAGKGAASIAALGEDVAGGIPNREGVYLFVFDAQGNFSELKRVL